MNWIVTSFRGGSVAVANATAEKGTENEPVNVDGTGSRVADVNPLSYSVVTNMFIGVVSCSPKHPLKMC